MNEKLKRVERLGQPFLFFFNGSGVFLVFLILQTRIRCIETVLYEANAQSQKWDAFRVSNLVNREYLMLREF